MYEFEVNLFFVSPSVMLKKNSNEVGLMKLDVEKLKMMTHAVGRAVMELALADQQITQQAIIDKLEHFRRDTGSVIGKGVNRDAAEIVRNGSKTAGGIKNPARWPGASKKISLALKQH